MNALRLSWLGFLLCCGAAWGQQAPKAAPAATSTPTPAKPPAPLRVAIDPQSPPFVYKSGDKLSGMEIEFASGLGDALGRPVVFVETPTANLINALLDDKADIVMSDFAVNRLRLVRAAFCNPYLRVGQLALCRRGELSIFSNNSNLQNVRVDVGVSAGTTGDMLVGSQFSFAGRKAYPTFADAIQALLDSKVDLVVADYPVALWLSAENEATVAVVPGLLSQEDLAWAVRKDDDVLRLSANAYLENLRKSGRLAEIVHKWVPDATPDTIAPGSTPIPAPTPPAATAAKK